MDTPETVGITALAVLAINYLGKAALEKIKPTNGNALRIRVDKLEKEVETLREWRHDMASVKDKVETVFMDFIGRQK